MNLIASLRLISSEQGDTGKVLGNSLTEILETCLKETFGLTTARENMSAVVRKLIESEKVEIPIEGCFEDGDQEGGPVPIAIWNMGELYEMVDGRTDETLEIGVKNWVPDAKRRTELEAMSRDELVLRVLELEAVL